jgi:hypothetical protein
MGFVSLSIMKVSTSIFSLSFIFLFGFLHLHPLLKEETKKETTCTKSKCQKPKPCEKKNDCNEGCNPFVPCSMGACCYLVENVYSPAAFAVTNKQKPALYNDNRLANRLSECWHPPEARS